MHACLCVAYVCMCAFIRWQKTAAKCVLAKGILEHECVCVCACMCARRYVCVCDMYVYVYICICMYVGLHYGHPELI